MRSGFITDPDEIDGRVKDRRELDVVGIKQTYLPVSAGDDQLSPRLSVLFRVGARTDLRASWGRFFQSQDILDLQVEDGVERFFPAQLADHSIVSIEHRFRNDLNVRIEAYTKRMPDLRPRYENLFETFTLLPELQPDRTRIAPAHAAARGIELLVSSDSPGAVNWWASYTRSLVEDAVQGRYVPRNWDQRHTVSGGLTWQRDDWTVTPALSYHTGWPTTMLLLGNAPQADSAASYRVVPGRRNTERLGDYQRIDVRASRSIDAGPGALEVFVEITNLLDEKNPCCVDYDLEFDSSGSSSIEQSVSFWLPRVTVIGVLWKF
ncbi:TonB-dependent receptor domain-containing protein [Candidatus Rariloculus sp.]|uniref:TonB-dependent receptor domain-containing protein n=1 Tax=Candidatus Rariloculus sp. TaxID=3101265 RepID=UPI003D11BC0C